MEHPCKGPDTGVGTAAAAQTLGGGCCWTEGLCGLLGQDISTGILDFVTAPGPAPGPAGPAQALLCSCSKHVQPEDSHNGVHYGKLAGVKIPESALTASHRTSLAELVAPRLVARPFQ